MRTNWQQAVGANDAYADQNNLEKFTQCVCTGPDWCDVVGRDFGWFASPSWISVTA
jgi:hypothetical protein